MSERPAGFTEEEWQEVEDLGRRDEIVERVVVGAGIVLLVGWLALLAYLNVRHGNALIHSMHPKQLLHPFSYGPRAFGVIPLYWLDLGTVIAAVTVLGGRSYY